jgi:KaiC/GvpD/RAD55 family RecA-like ATPase/CheY-like chemotaxis protein
MQQTGVELIDDVVGGVVPGLPLVVTGAIGTGRTLLCLELAAAALRRRERVVYVTADRGSMLLRQAQSFGTGFEAAVRSGRMVLLELDARVSATMRAHGGEPFVEALREEAPDARLLVVDGLRPLVQDLLDPLPLRAAVEAVLCGMRDPGQLTVASADLELLHAQPLVERALDDVCGALVELSREASGERAIAVRKSRLGRPLRESARFELRAEGLRLVDAPVAQPVAPLPTPPVSSPAPPPERAAAAVPPPPPPRADPERRLRVLVIDEDDAPRSQLVGWLAERYQVSTARDGLEALSGIMASRPDAMILELCLPRVSGYEVLRACQRARLQVPTLVLSWRMLRAADRIRPLVLGASDVMTKPPSRVELLHRVDALLRSAPPSTSREDAPDDDALFLTPSASRRVDESDFRERCERAQRFGERFDVPSTIVAVEAAAAAELAAFATAADGSLRAEDSLFLVAERRALLLLVASDAKQSVRVLDRVAARAREAHGRKLRLRARHDAVDATAGTDLDKRFEALEPLGGAA